MPKLEKSLINLGYQIIAKPRFDSFEIYCDNAVEVHHLEALEGLKLLSETEGIIPALETSHAVAFLSKIASELNSDDVVILNVSGRGDKDMETVSKKMASL